MNTTTHMTHRPSTSSSLWAGLVRELQERRQVRAADRALERKLASHTTPSEIHDVLAAADRHEGADAERVRHILTSRAAVLPAGVRWPADLAR